MIQSLPTAIVVLLCLLVFSSCNRQKTTAGDAQSGENTPVLVDKPDSRSVPQSTDSPSRPVTQVSLDNLLPDVASLAEDNLGEWSEEAFHQAASSQLKKLKHLILKRELTNKALSSVALEAAWSGRLSSGSDKVTYQDERVIARRRTEPHQTERHDLREELGSLADEFATASEKYGQLKVSGVRDLSTSIETTVEVQFVGKSAARVTQYNARWQCVWTKEPANKPKLTFIQPVDQTLATSNSTAFCERTNGVVGATESFQKQLAYGVDHWMERVEQRYGINSSGWQGLAIGDVNGDDLDDVYFLQPGGLSNRLYVQQQDGSVKDVSAESGADWWDHCHAALFLDLDNDGDQDLVVATALGLIFMANEGTGRFEVATSELCPQAMPFTLAAADSDSDGDLDIYACCYSPRGTAIGTQFLARPVPYHDANNGGRNCFFRNDGNWEFKNATVEVGLDQNNRRFSLAASWEDYDNDGDQDLYVANDYGRNNLYRNDNGHFKDVAESARVEDLSAGMSVTWGDYDHDGHMDLYVSNMWSSAGNRIAYQRQFQSASNDTTKAKFQRHARGNSLFLNQGDGTFTDETIASGVSLGRWAWGSKFVDLNNDGLDDLVVANGFITQADETDL